MDQGRRIPKASLEEHPTILKLPEEGSRGSWTHWKMPTIEVGQSSEGWNMYFNCN